MCCIRPNIGNEISAQHSVQGWFHILLQLMVLQTEKSGILSHEYFAKFVGSSSCGSVSIPGLFLKFKISIDLL